VAAAGDAGALGPGTVGVVVTGPDPAAAVSGDEGAAAAWGAVIGGMLTGADAAESRAGVVEAAAGAAADSSAGRDAAHSWSSRWMPPVGPGDRK
jgi:hypothetical protein